MLKKTLRNQKGFTLIEIIAVLVILGILAAVAIPKYLDLATEARNKAAAGAIAALQSTATQSFAQQLLNGGANATTWDVTLTGSPVTVGDYTGTITGVRSVVVTVTGPADRINGVSAANLTKTFNLW